MAAMFHSILGTMVFQFKINIVLWKYSYKRMNSRFWLTQYFITNC